MKYKIYYYKTVGPKVAFILSTEAKRNKELFRNKIELVQTKLTSVAGTSVSTLGTLQLVHLVQFGISNWKVAGHPRSSTWQQIPGNS